jgi:acyl-CoA thioesterase I
MNVTRALGLLLLACALSACGREAAPARSMPGDSASKVATAAGEPSATGAKLVIPADAPLVVFLGDSIAAGLHLSVDQAFPAVLQRDFAREGRPFRVVNAGVSGDTSAGGLRRVDWILKQKPDVLVVELGGNDGLRGQDVKGIEENLRQIVQRAKDAGARVLLLGVRMPSSYGAAYSEEFAAIYPRLAREQGVPLVPYFMEKVGGVPELTLEDGLHPTAKGHELLAANIAPKLREVLNSLH